MAADISLKTLKENLIKEKFKFYEGNVKKSLNL